MPTGQMTSDQPRSGEDSLTAERADYVLFPCGRYTHEHLLHADLTNLLWYHYHFCSIENIHIICDYIFLQLESINI